MNTEYHYDSLKKIIPTVSRETVNDLIDFESLFKKWSKAINLASPNTLNVLWERHILDSAQLYSLAENTKTWLDLGSGGGFPGIVLAILMQENNDSSIKLVESNGKKAAFLKSAIRQFQKTDNNLAEVFNSRIEDCYQIISVPEVITARALASLDKLFYLTEPWMVNGASALFQKGRDYEREIDESLKDWDFDLKKYDSVIETGSVILKVSNLRRR